MRRRAVIIVSTILCFLDLGCSTAPRNETIPPQITGRGAIAKPMRPGFPSYPPIRDANPQIRSKQRFQVPTRLIVERTTERIEISVDANSLETIEREVGRKMVTGFKHDTFIVWEEQRKDCGGGLGPTATFWTSDVTRKIDGIPKADENYIIEVTFVVFETDIPAQHMWMPQSGRYKQLWSRTLTSEEL